MKTLPIIVAHDYQCPWSYLSLFQAERLQKEFPTIELDWQGYELLPRGPAELPDRPQPSERFEALAELDSIPLPLKWPGITITHNAMEGAEYIKDKNPKLFNGYNESVYRAYWDEAEDISDLAVLATIANTFGVNTEDFIKAIKAKQYLAKITKYPEPAYNKGIRQLTTFKFIGEQCSEASYATIQEMTKRYISRFRPLERSEALR